MNKKNIFLILALTFVLFFIPNVDAASTCTKDELTNLKTEALYIESIYELRRPSTEGGADPTLYFYDITLTNVTNQYNVKVGSVTYDSTAYKDGILTVESAYTMGGYYASIYVYASSKTNCNGELARTIKLYIPHWNAYSERDECQDYQDYDICNPTANTTDITEEEFLKRIEKIKEEEKKVEDPIVEEETTLEKIINFINENKKVIIPVTVVAIFIIVLIIIKVIQSRRKKIKVDLGDKI